MAMQVAKPGDTARAASDTRSALPGVSVIFGYITVRLSSPSFPALTENGRLCVSFRGYDVTSYGRDVGTGTPLAVAWLVN